jgi:endoglycosylceramidase
MPFYGIFGNPDPKIMKKSTICIILTSLILSSSCGLNKTGVREPLLILGINGRQFVEPGGKPLILYGINLVEKDPLKNYIPGDTAGLFEKFRQWGFNCIRLGIFWDGAEPEPGTYDEAYLDQIEQLVLRAGSHGLYVLLDMHQDLFGRTFGDGNPGLGDGASPWATLTDDLPHYTGAIWSDSYLISPAVQRAFDNFWTDKEAPDGIGIQEHYAGLWNHIASRFADNPAVIGYDIMNEPFNGSGGAAILPVILKEYATLVAEETGKVLSDDEVLSIWSDEIKRIEALKFLDDPDQYSRVIDAARELNAEFERTLLQPFYQRTADEIRKADSTHILFLEHAYFANTGMSTAIEPVKRQDGSPDPLVAYAAHGYDLLTDTRQVDAQSSGRVALIFSRIHEASIRMNVPVLIGEWGAFHGSSEDLAGATRFILNLFDKYGFSHTYWAYHAGIEEEDYFIRNFIKR